MKYSSKKKKPVASGPSGEAEPDSERFRHFCCNLRQFKNGFQSLITLHNVTVGDTTLREEKWKKTSQSMVFGVSISRSVIRAKWAFERHFYVAFGSLRSCKKNASWRLLARAKK